MNRIIVYFLVLCSSLIGTFASAASFTADGLSLVLTLDDGRELRAQSLVGIRFTIGTGVEERDIRIDGIFYEGNLHGAAATLYNMSVFDGKSHEFRNMCQADAEGDRAVIAFPNEHGGFSLTCSAGAEGKCIIFGYFPWEKRDNVPMQDLYRSCVRMIRADYGGDGTPATRNGISINVFDRFGIQNPARVSWMEFEAAWGPDGAVCVNHTRIADYVSLDELAERYPHLKGKLGPQACFEENGLRDQRALIFNESRLTWRSHQ